MRALESQGVGHAYVFRLQINFEARWLALKAQRSCDTEGGKRKSH